MDKSKTIDDLRNEHEAILFTLKVLTKLNRMAENNIPIERLDVDKLLDFLKVFADQCHHGKEEQYLFTDESVLPGMLPLNKEIFLAAHRQARRYILQMEEVLKATRGVELILPPAFREAAENYINLLHEHIETENGQLFPAFTKALSQEQDNELFQKFAQFEAEVIGEGVHEQYHQLLDYLDQKYLRVRV